MTTLCSRGAAVMEFSPTMIQRVSREMPASPYYSRQSGLSPTRISSPSNSYHRSPASGQRHHHHQQPQQQHRHLHYRGDDQRRVDRQVEAMLGSPQAKRSPKFHYPPYISCMFAAAPAAELSPTPSSPLLSSPSSVSSSPYYHHRDLNSNTKRQIVLKENDRSPAVQLQAPSPHSSLSGKKTLPLHCKRRLDFNHNRVSDNDLDLDFGLSFAATTQTIDELALSFTPALSPSLSQPPGDAVSLGRVPAVAVARRNERERNRVKLINMTFATLREHLPHGAAKGGKNRKMSKVETLRAAIEYIRQLHTEIKEKQQQHSSCQAGQDNIHDTHSNLIKMEAIDMDVDTALMASETSLLLASSSASLLALSSPSSAGGAQSPASDDGCSTYDHLSTEEEDLLEFASNWF